MRTNSAHPQFQLLVGLLDAELKVRDGDDHAFYSQYNKTVNINHVILYVENDEAIACGAFKHWDNETAEVKRMFVLPNFRNKGIASSLLSELEIWIAELSFSRIILETGINQPEAIQLYSKNNYMRIPNYGQYENALNSCCYSKNFN